MIKHIVLFQLKPFSSESEKQQKMAHLKLRLEQLIDKVPSLISIEVGLNSNPNEQYEIALTTTFHSLEDLQAYAVHPDHQAVARELREVMEKRACVDYQV